MEKHYKFIPFISGLFVATLIISNTLDTKIFHAFSLDLPAGIILFPLAYVFGDILTEVYGYVQARKVIWTGFLSLILMIFSYEIARTLPPAGFWPNQAAFDTVFSHVPRIALASIAAYFCGEFVNSYVLAKMKIFQKGHKMSVRFVASTLCGQCIDTAVFIVIAFAGAMPVSALLSIFISGWGVKVAWEIIALPITIPFVKFLKKHENVDVFDYDTNFNPIKLS